MSKSLPQALAEFNTNVVLDSVKQRLDSDDSPIALVTELQKGMSIVGERFSDGRYFLSELIMSADLFTQAMKMIEPHMAGQSMQKIGRIVVGTPKGDIHDLGKNIFCTVARGSGFEVHDLGVDVPSENFVAAVEDLNPEILGFSALITTAFDEMKRVVDELVKRGLRDQLKVIVGGGVTTETVKRYIGADFQTIDALAGLDQCKAFLRFDI